MSKKMFALAMVVAFVLAFASVAYATWGDSGYITTGQMVGATAEVAPYNPHGPYDTTSRKCAVCHAVHNADPNGVILLKVTGGDPCVYCHVTTDAGVKIVYDGTTAKYTSDSEFAHNQFTGASMTNFGCRNCHTVHGAGAATISDSVGNLKDVGTTYANAIKPSHVTSGFADGTPANLTEWCSGCHPYYNTGYNGATHVMKAATVNYDNAASTLDTTVAWRSSANCKSCHDSNVSTNGTIRTPTAPATLSTYKFPHYTSGARFLTSAASSAAAATQVTAGQASYDGVCLKCHRDGTGKGVGLNF